MSILRQTNLELISHSEISSVVKLPDGLNFQCLDLQTGFVSPVGVIGAMLFARSVAFRTRDHGTDFMSASKLNQDHLLFVLFGEAKMSKDIYDVEVAKYPVSVETNVVSFRKSSFVVENSLYLQSYHTPVASLSTNIVCVARETRKSTPLPDWWAEKYEKLFEKAPGPNFKPLVAPNETICQGLKSQLYTFPVRRRDHDGYGHVNTGFYMQYCLDALEHHLSVNNINCDIHMVSLLLKTAQWLHKGESHLGDILAVAFWDEKTDSETVCFDITKSGRSIYQARMQFYGGSEINSGTKSHL